MNQSLPGIMARNGVLVLLTFILGYTGTVQSQNFHPDKAAVLVSAVAPGGKQVYIIRLTFEGQVTSQQEQLITTSDNWEVTGQKVTYRVDSVSYNSLSQRATLYGNWKPVDRFTVLLEGNQGVTVNTTDDSEQPRWNFGEGSSVELNVRRLAETKSRFALDHNLDVSIAERNLTLASGGIWLRSFSLDFTSEGTVTALPEVRNGSKSNLELALNPFFFAGNMIYRTGISTGLQVETALDTAATNLLDVQNTRFKLGVELEVPFTNYPITQLHKRTGYARLAMPLTVGLDYIAGESDKPGRLDLNARYELAFSPYLIVQGEWRYSNFFEGMSGIGEDAHYYSVGIAQDLTEAEGVLKILKYITTLGLIDEESEGRNFIFFKITEGRKAPLYRDISERSFGFGVYF